MSDPLEGEVLAAPKDVAPAPERPWRYEYVITELPVAVWRDEADTIEAIPLETAIVGRRR